MTIDSLVIGVVMIVECEFLSRMVHIRGNIHEMGIIEQIRIIEEILHS